MQTTTDLKSSAILIDFDGGYFNWSRRDRSVEREVADQKAIRASAGRYLKNLFLACDAPLTAIRTEVQNARADHNLLTIPWGPAQRLLLNRNFLEYNSRFSAHEATLETLKANLADSYTSLVAQAAASLGPLYNPEDYPPVEKVLSGCYISRTLFPLSDSSDVRLQIGDDSLSAIKAEVEATLTSRIADATTSIWDRFRTILKSATDNLSKSPGTGTRYRSEWHAHLTELLTLLPGLNLTNDSTLTAFALRCQSLITTPSEDYEVSLDTRTQGFTLAFSLLSEVPNA